MKEKKQILIVLYFLKNSKATLGSTTAPSFIITSSHFYGRPFVTNTFSSRKKFNDIAISMTNKIFSQST